nr:hypothetical protein [Tanacetum cinerariifolium]
MLNVTYATVSSMPPISSLPPFMVCGAVDRCVMMSSLGSVKAEIVRNLARQLIIRFAAMSGMTKDEAGNEIKVPPVTTEQILARTRERKAKSTLLMAILDEHLARFHRIKDAKTLWALIKTRFSAGLDKGYDRFQRLLSLLEIHEAGSSGSSSNSQNVAFVSAESTSSTNELNAAYSVSTATGHSSQAQGLFARDCKSARNSGNMSRDAENAGYRGRDNEEEATDFALMAFTSNPSSSSISNSEVQSYSKQCEQSYEQLKTLFDEQREKLSKANIKIIGYQYGLESIEGQLRVHQQNKVICAEKIGVLEYQVKDKSNLLKYTQKQLDEALNEKEDLKSKLEKFETSLNLTKLLDSQISAKVKTCLGYDSQFNKKEVLDIKEEEVIETVFDNHSSDEENSVANDRFKKGEGYHAVPPPLTGNYMPPKPDLSFGGLDDSIYKFKISKKVTSLAKDEKDAHETSTAYVEKPKEDRSSAPFIEDWETGSDDDNVFTPKPIPDKIDFVKAVFTRSSRIPVSAAKPKAAASTSVAKPVNTAGPKQSVNFSRTRSTFHKSHSPIIRSFYNATTHSRRNSTKRVNTDGLKAVSVVKGNRVTAVKTSTAAKPVNTAEPKQSVNFSRTRISANKGNRVTAVKTSAGYVWRPRVNAIDQLSKGHPQQALKNKGIVDSGCSRHMTGNKAYLVDYQEINDGGFVAFGSSRVFIRNQSDKDELDRLISQGKKDSDAVDALRKEFEQGCIDQRGVTQAGSTNSFNTEIVELQSTGIFNSAYDDDLDIYTSPVQCVGTEANFNNMESFTIVSPIPIHKVYKNRKNERSIVVRNKARLVAQGHRQEEGIDYDEVFADMARIEAIRIFLAFASFMGFIVYQMDVNSAFLYGIIENKVYVYQPPSFIDPQFLNKVYKVEKALYGLHQAPKPGLQVKQSEEGIFISLDKYVVEILKKFDFSSVKTASTPMETQKPLVKDEVATDVDVHLYRSMIGSLMYLTASRLDIMFVVCACSRDSPFDLEAYLDSDYAGANLNRKSITGGFSFYCWMKLCTASTIVDAAELKKTEENAEFHQIVDFISTCSIHYALTTRFETASKRGSDLPLSTGHTVTNGEDKMEQETDLTDFVPPIPHDLPFLGGHTPGSDKEDKGSGEKGGSTADQVSIARPKVCAATPSTPPITTTIFGDEDLTIAQTLIKIRSEKEKEKRVAFRDVEEPPRLTRSTTTLQPLPTIDPKHKELDKAQKKRQKQKDATIAALIEEFDEIQARMDADHELIVRMTHEEQEMYTIKERARLLAESFKRRNKQLAAERAKEIKNKPPIRTQVRNIMITYLKHIGKYTHQQLKHKTLKELQMLYEREKKWIDNFVPMDFKKEEKKSVEPESKDKKGKRIKKVADSAPKQKSSKKQKMMQE